MNITDINFAIDVLSHPQNGDESDIDKALNIAMESLKMWKERLEQESCEEQDICEKAYKDGYDKGWYDGFYIGKNRWIPVDGRLPAKGGEYLVTSRVASRSGIDILSFAKDLYKVDKYDFGDKKGVSGWFYYDGEYGYIEVGGVIAWMPLPEKYKESEDKE